MNKQVFSEMYEEDRDVSSLVEKIEKEYEKYHGSIFYKFPTIKEFDKNPVQPDVLVVSEKHGVVIIIADEMNARREDTWRLFLDKKESIDNCIYTGLLKNKSLKLNNRALKFSVNTIGFCPNLIDATEEENVYTSVGSILKYLDSIRDVESIPDNVLNEIVASLESSTAIIKPKERILADDETNTKAKILKDIETKIARFDDEQRLSALSLLDGPQRIRGLAGSGKTIILCLKAANLHLMYPDKKILYTFFTRSLYDYIVRLISRFFMKMTDGQLPDYNKIRVLHAWGGRSVPGVYYEACRSNGISPLTLGDARGKGNAFEYVCSKFIEETHNNPRKDYDYVLMDEAQDFSVSFYQLCRAIVKDDHLIWCYDEVQNIFDVELQNTKTTFSNNYDSKGIDLEAEFYKHPYIKNDVVLHKSYRNVKEILLSAVALGFGIYNDKLIQSLENNKHWEDLGFKVILGDCSKEENVVIEREEDASPLRIDDTQLAGCVIGYEASSFADELNWIATEIEKAIKEDHLLPEDIAVISLDERNALSYMKGLEKRFFEKSIDSFNVMDRNYVKGFCKEGKVTLSSVFKAKGNEAAMVFVCGCDIFEIYKDERHMRNTIFTAFTRAKVWLRISGIGALKHIRTELDKLKENNYKLCFLNKPTHLLDRDWNEKTGRMTEDEKIREKIAKECKRLGITTDEYLKKYIMVDEEKIDD